MHKIPRQRCGKSDFKCRNIGSVNTSPSLFSPPCVFKNWEARPPKLRASLSALLYRVSRQRDHARNLYLESNPHFSRFLRFQVVKGPNWTCKNSEIKMSCFAVSRLAGRLKNQKEGSPDSAILTEIPNGKNHAKINRKGHNLPTVEIVQEVSLKIQKKNVWNRLKFPNENYFFAVFAPLY